MQHNQEISNDEIGNVMKELTKALDFLNHVKGNDDLVRYIEMLKFEQYQHESQNPIPSLLVGIRTKAEAIEKIIATSESVLQAIQDHSVDDSASENSKRINGHYA